MDQTLHENVSTSSNSTSSYFDFVEEKAVMQSASRTTIMEQVTPGKDAFVVQVMDEETSRTLKQQYFGGHSF